MSVNRRDWLQVMCCGCSCWWDWLNCAHALTLVLSSCFWHRTDEGEWAFGNREGHGVFWLKEKPLKTPEQIEEAKTNTSPGLLGKTTVAPQAKLRRVYAGNWKNDMKDGVGVYFYRDGSRYEGNWEEDQRSGRGTLYMTVS
jgi:hypothetical protein